MSAVALALMALGGSPAFATDIVISTPTTSLVTLGNGDNLNVIGTATNTGSIVVAGPTGVLVPTGTVAGSITNSGSISGGSDGIVLGASTLTGGITNTGSISGGGVGIVLGASTLTGGINNSGSISGGGVGIVLGASTLTGGINNSGSISGGGVGIVLGESNLTGGINNSGSISGGRVGIVLGASTLTGGITNSGTISGGQYAIFVDSDSTVGGGIAVTGTSAVFTGDISAPTTNFTLSSSAAFTNTNSMSVSGVLVSSGATFNLTNALSSSGSVAGNINVGNGYVTNQGVVDVGARGGVNTPTITGNFTQDAGGTFRTTVVSDTAYGQLYVSGSATLAGIAEVSVSGVAGALAQGTTLAGVIQVGGTLTGQFEEINSNANATIYRLTGQYTGQSFNLLFAAKPNAVYGNVLTYGTPAALGAATALDQIAINPGALAPVLDTLDVQSGQTQANSVAQTLPVLAGASSMVAAQAQTAFNEVMQSRQSQLRGMSTGEQFAGNRDAWGKAFGGWANQGDINNVSGYKVDGGGSALGVDKQLSTKSNIGFALAYAYSDVKSNSSVAPSSVNVSSYQLGLYGDYALQPDVQLVYQLDGAVNTNSSTRSLSAFAGTTGVGANANGQYNSYVGHAGIGIKKFFSINPTTRLTPTLRLDYTTVQTDGYTETGAGLLNLAVKSQTYNALYTSADMRLDHSLSNGLNVSGNVGLGYNALNTKAQLTSTYVGGGPSFVTNGLDVSPWLYNAGVGIGGMISKDVELNVRYDINFSSTNYTNQMVSANVKWLF
jgi:outer membrane autotransporter protein